MPMKPTRPSRWYRRMRSIASCAQPAHSDFGVDHGDHADLGIAAAQALEGLVKTLLALLERLVIDQAPMEAEHQAFTMGANRRTDGVDIIDISAGGRIAEQIDVVDPAGYRQVEHRLQILAVGEKVLGAKTDHADLQARSSQDSRFHIHPHRTEVI